MEILRLGSNWKRGGAVEACWAHNPEVGGSKPLPATLFTYSSKVQINLHKILHFLELYIKVRYITRLHWLNNHGLPFKSVFVHALSFTTVRVTLQHLTYVLA